MVDGLRSAGAAGTSPPVGRLVRGSGPPWSWPHPDRPWWPWPAGPCLPT